MLMPAQIIRAALVLAAVIAVIAIVVGSRQAAVNITLIEQDGKVAGLIRDRALAPVTVVAGTRRVQIEPADLVRDSDVFDTAAALNRFYLRQTELADMMHMQGAHLDVGGRRVAIRAHRGIRNVAKFWIILLPGLIGLIVSAIVWVANPRSLPNQLIAVTGLAFPFVTAGIAITVSRDIAIDGELFRRLFHMHEISGLTFAILMVALFCVYPRRIISPRLLGLLAAGLFAWGIVIGAARWVEWVDPAPGGIMAQLMVLRTASGGSQVMVCILLLALCAALLVQYRVTRGDPLSRAALTWFGLSVALGAGGSIAILTLPNVLGARLTVDATVGFPLLLLIYAGLTLGMLRYRLFEAKAWSFRVLFAACATAALWLVDALMIYALGLDQGPALGLSVVLVGFAYQPARAWLATLLRRDAPMSEREMFATAIDVAFAPAAVRAVRFRAMMQRSFEPLEVRHDESPNTGDPIIIDDGLTLIVPDPVAGPALRMSYPGGGKRLYAPADLTLVRQMTSLCRQAADALQSYDRGAADERRRMAQDLHDDVGARLLSGIYIAQGPVRTLLQDALRDIRTLVTGLIGETAPLSRVLADIRHETASRLEAAAIALDWPILLNGATDRLVPYLLSKAITSTIREAVSNTIRHAGAKLMTVRIDVEESGGTIDVQDDGNGFAADCPRGNGLNGIAARMAQIGGTFTLTNDAGAAHLAMTFPLGDLPPFPLSKEQQHA